MKYLIKNIVFFTRDTVMFIYFLLQLCRWRCFCNPVKKKYTGTIVVLANGPSLKEVIPLLTKDEAFKDVDFIVMNYFAFDDVFFKIRPKHYCLADPMFFNETYRIDEVRKLYAFIEEKTDWKINIYIPHYIKNFKKFSGITNNNVNIIKINNISYNGYKYFRNFFYRRGLSTPFIGSVVQLAIFVCINSGYSDIMLYGVDHTFFDSLYVNENNQLCNKQTHFYTESEVNLLPIRRIDNGEIWKISDYLTFNGLLFKSHDLLANYAEYTNVNIINCTKNSLIDSYKRHGQ